MIYISSVLLHLFFFNPSYSQRAKIDSLKKVLPSLHDSARVDCLNVLSLVYTYLNIDTSRSYAQKAHTEASAIKYLRGLAMSLNNEARIAGFGLHDFQLQEEISLQTIQLHKSLPDKKVIAESYMNLAIALFCQSYFERSNEACRQVVQLSQAAGDLRALGEATAIMASISLETGNYEKSFEYFNQSLGIFKSISDSYNTAIVLARIGDLYRLAGDHKTALSFYFQSLKYPKGTSLVWHPLMDLGDTYYWFEQFDSSLYDREIYSQAIKSLTIRSNYIAFSTIRLAEKHIEARQFDAAIDLLTEDLKLSRKNNNSNLVMRLLLDISVAYEGKKEYGKAFNYANDLLQNARRNKAKQYIRDGYRLMYMLYNQMKYPDSAYIYHQLYTDMKDSVALEAFSKKMAIYKAATENEKKQSQIELLNSENLVSQQQLQLSEQQLKDESVIRNIIIAGILFFLLLGFIIFRNVMLKQKNTANRQEIMEKELSLQKLESARTKSELQQQATELEMQALRAQMNPHFIFNSLSSINYFVLKNQTEIASDYLTKFSRLIRMVLNYSQKKLISLEEELEILQLYLELERLRFKNSFDFEVTRDTDIDAGAIFIPPLIFQPFAENAIWHGIMHSEAYGRLDIAISKEEDMLSCTITDNGIGRKKAGELKGKTPGKQKSMGIQITKQRLALLNQDMRENEFYVVDDLVDGNGIALGTKITLKIRYKYLIE